MNLARTRPPTFTMLPGLPRIPWSVSRSPPQEISEASMVLAHVRDPPAFTLKPCFIWPRTMTSPGKSMCPVE